MSDITLIMQAVCRGEKQASEELLPLVYDELRRLAAARMAQQGGSQTLQATALVHEAWLRLVADESRNWQNRAHFFRAAAQAMRQILVDRARHKLSLKCGGGMERLNIEDMELPDKAIDGRVLLVDECLKQLETEDPERAKVVTLKFFGGLTNKDVAEVLGVSERSVDRQWAYAKTVLFEMIQAKK